MAEITTVTPITYSMKVDSRSATNFEPVNTEQTFTVTNITITPVATTTGAETNYQLPNEVPEQKGTVLPGTINVTFSLTAALAAGKTLGWRLESGDATNADFQYGTNYTDQQNPEFATVNDAAFVAAENDPPTGTIYWQNAAALPATDPITIPIKINYIKGTPVPGDAITFTVRFFVKSVQTGVDDVIYTAGISGTSTITVYTSVLTANIKTLAYASLGGDAVTTFNVADRIIFKTVITAATTNQFYRQPIAVNFAQTMNGAITASTIYINDADITTGDGDSLAAGTKRAITVTNNTVSFSINAANPVAEDADFIDNGLVKNLYVWVVALITKIPE